MKRIWSALCMLMLTIMLSGCWDRIEVNDMAIITAAGLDAGADHSVELSMQLFLPNPGKQSGGAQGLSQGGGSAESRSSMVRTVTGQNMADAMSKMQVLLPRRVYWGHINGILIGEELARRGLEDAMDFFTRHPAPRERSNMYIVEGKARTILEWEPPLERNSAETLRKMSEQQTGLNVNLLQATKQMSGLARTAVIPYVTMDMFRSNEVPIIHASAVIKDNKLAGIITDSDTRGMLWLRNQIKTAMITVMLGSPKETVSVQIAKARTRLVPEIKDGSWSLHIHVDASGSFHENTTKLNVAELKQTKRMESLVADELISRMKQVMEPAIRMEADVAGFAEVFHKKYPKEMKQVKNEWDQKLQDIHIEYHIAIRIGRTGLTTKSPLKQK